MMKIANVPSIVRAVNIDCQPKNIFKKLPIIGANIGEIPITAFNTL